jgi:hypothetical protein
MAWSPRSRGRWAGECAEGAMDGVLAALARLGGRRVGGEGESSTAPVA